MVMASLQLVLLFATIFHVASVSATGLWIYTKPNFSGEKIWNTSLRDETGHWYGNPEYKTNGRQMSFMTSHQSSCFVYSHDRKFCRCVDWKGVKDTRTWPDIDWFRCLDNNSNIGCGTKFC